MSALRNSISILIVSVAATGCPTYTFVEKVPQEKKEANIIVPAAKPTPSDILFVVDNSGSMADEQENLATNFDAFINQIAGAGDYRIAIVTTDLETRYPNEREGLVVSTFSPDPPNVLTRYDNVSGCSDTDIPHGCFRGDDPNTRIITSDLPADQQIQLFASNVRVGSCGSGTEQGLAGMITALEAGCNSGFLRDAANLVVVLVSDEEDGSPGDVSTYVNQLIQIKNGAAKVRVATIVGAGPDGQAARCALGGSTTCGSACQMYGPATGSMSQCPPAPGMCPNGELCNSTGLCVDPEYQYWNDCHWCSFYDTPDCCSALAGNRYVQFARLMETEINAANSAIPIANCQGEPGTRIGCLVDSICQENFSATLERIAKDLVLTNEYTLDPGTEYPPGVVVKIDGVQLTYAVDYTVSNSTAPDGHIISVVNIIGQTPQEGQIVEIYYILPEGE